MSFSPGRSILPMVTKKVVTETVEKKGGVQTTTTTITCTKDDFDAAFKKLNVDPEKFKSGGTTVTRQIIYTNSAGAKEVLQETVESFDKPGISTKVTKTETSPKKTCDNPASVHSPEKKGKPQKAGKFEEECLKKHNEYRGKHGVPKLELSDEVRFFDQLIPLGLLECKKLSLSLSSILSTVKHVW
ncbi:golgi-associated plant pathogenesis-related protein 1 [Trichonephila clavipes]|nr:golgi-associated plant pathogenesis-related protein 1 [Trichonephila clavipes]